jgi:hypothetical protein
MKKYLLILLLFIGPLLAMAQEEEQKEKSSDTTRVKVGKLNVTITEDDTKVSNEDEADEDDDEDHDSDLKDELTHWGGIDLGVNVLLTPDNDTDYPEGSEWLEQDYARSLSWSFNIFETKIRIVKDYVSIVTGLGLTYNSYTFGDTVNIVTNEIVGLPGDSTFADVGDYHNFDKNKFRASYLKIPLMLEFNTSLDPERTFHVAGGVIGGWNMGTIKKQKYENEGAKVKNREKGDFNLTPFTLDAAVRVGYRNYTLFANYGLTPFFEDGKGPELHNLTVGLALVPW